MTVRDAKIGNQGSNQVAQARDWGGSPEVDSAVAVWPVSEHKHQGSSGGGSSGEADGWNTFSPGQSNSSRHHSQSENWMSDEGSLNIGENVCSLHSNSSPSPSNGEWCVPDVPDVQHELEPIEDDELDAEVAASGADSSGTGASAGVQFHVGHRPGGDGSGGEERGKVVGERSMASWDDLDDVPLSSSDKESVAVGQGSSKQQQQQGPSSASPDDLTRSKTSSRSPSVDTDKTVDSGDSSSGSGGSDGDGRTSRDRETHKPHEDSVTIATHSQSNSVTPDGLGMSAWKARPSVGGSTSSINSAGSNSSWKSEGKNGYHSKPPNFSPRKTNRCMHAACLCYNVCIYMYMYVKV